MLLTLELAIVLPATALIVFSILQLRSIQRDRAVEAAIQRDFQYLLKIAEKRVAQQGFAMIETMRQQFPCPEDKPGVVLEGILASNPHIAAAFVYDSKQGTFFRTRTEWKQDAELRMVMEKSAEMYAGWFKIDSESMHKALKKMEASGEPPYRFYYELLTHPTKQPYLAQVFFPLPRYPAGDVALGGIIFEPDHFAREFLPRALDSVLHEEMRDQKGNGGHPNPVVIMARLRKSNDTLAASHGWDGGKPEVERLMEMAFPGLVLAAKFRGTTVEALAGRFLRNNFLIIGGLSLLLVGGIVLTYRNVTREMALAKLKSDFVSNVSHELRTPLSLIRLYAETLELNRVTGAEKQQEYFAIIRKESERLTALINNILDFSRIEAGRKEYEFTETNLAELVRQTLESYRDQIEQHGFQFEQHITSDVPPIPVDREAMARSLLNLVNNAIKYSNSEKFLRVNLYRDNGSVKLEVIDRGIGIPRSEQVKIFEKFYRSGDPLVHNTKGSGLGLSLVRHIVEAHGGTITVESAPGRGSKFTISLPLRPGGGSQQAAA